MARMRIWAYTRDGVEHYIQHQYMCPGCNRIHAIGKNLHTISANLDLPTVSPSVLYASHPICHAYIKDGRIQFLTDCEHSLAGQTVDLPEIEPITPYE